jgi:hypothetical protein
MRNWTWNIRDAHTRSSKSKGKSKGSLAIGKEKEGGEQDGCGNTQPINKGLAIKGLLNRMRLDLHPGFSCAFFRVQMSILNKNTTLQKCCLILKRAGT